MQIKFKSHMEKALLVNAFIFARHQDDAIAQVRALRSDVAKQMEEENRQWSEALRKLDAPTLEIEL